MAYSSPVSTNKQIATAKAPQEQPTSFLSLLLELRTMIYQHALATTSPAIIPLPKTTSTSWCTHTPAPKPAASVNLLRTCRQIYHEAVQHAYTSRSFLVGKSCKLCFQNLYLDDSASLREIPESTIHKIRSLELRLNINCTSKLAVRKKLPRTQVQLKVTGQLQSLKFLKVKIMFFRHDFSLLKYLLFEVQDPSFVKLFTQVYCAVNTEVEVDWEVELDDGGDMSNKAELEEAGTEELRRLAASYQDLQGVGGKSRSKKTGKRKVVQASSSLS
jgi:hypothetical protein